jgi:hypothetical protein
MLAERTRRAVKSLQRMSASIERQEAAKRLAAVNNEEKLAKCVSRAQRSACLTHGGLQARRLGGGAGRSQAADAQGVTLSSLRGRVADASRWRRQAPAPVVTCKSVRCGFGLECKEGPKGATCVKPRPKKEVTAAQVMRKAARKRRRLARIEALKRAAAAEKLRR